MHDNHTILENRVTRELFERIQPAQLGERVALSVSARTLSGEPVPVSEVIRAEFAPIVPGTPWGRPWSTTWFHVTGNVPAHLVGDHLEIVAEIGFSGSLVGFQAEGAVYVDGRIICGIHPQRRFIPLDLVMAGDGRIDFMIEAAANVDFVSSFLPDPRASLLSADGDPMYSFGGVDLVVVNTEVRELFAEVNAANALMRALPQGEPRRLRLQHHLQRVFDTLDVSDVVGTATSARAEITAALRVQGPADAHRVTAVGHAHIDTAWLWPMRETKRKCARTFANAVRLMEEHPQFRFACSQAVQYHWIEQQHPELFADIQERARTGQWLPVGGMWVEADMNLPSGESLARQLVHGQRYFEERFGRRCEEIWIPDVFGYPGSLPQIFAQAGCRRFVTQKLSWNKQNRFPHHTFHWAGIDGTEVLAHFPPVDNYNAEIEPGELLHSVTNFRDHYWSDNSLMPFGYGDGGGGPTREMLHRVELLGGTQGLPRIELGGPADFFERVEQEATRFGIPRWQGELYFEMHRGTFTTQAATKLGNRRCENLLREAELWLASIGDGSHSAQMDTLWKRVLVQQFHDILPGSSIAWVHADAEREHTEVQAELEALILDALQRAAPDAPTVANAGTHARDEVVVSPKRSTGADESAIQTLSTGETALRVRVPGLGMAPALPNPAETPVQVSAGLLANGLLEVRFNGEGEVVSVWDVARQRELVPAESTTARLTLAPDHPVEFDAWDLEQWTASLAKPLGTADAIEVIEVGPLLGSVQLRWSFGESTVCQTFTLRAGSARLDIGLDVDWHESEKLLAIEFPLDVRSDRAACEIQFGHEHRPTHRSTSWDDAKFEVCAHRFVDLSEATFGVAVLNDGRYGHAVQDGGIRVSLLRATRYPDPDADRGRHRVTVSLLSHGPGLTEVLAEAEALNLPLRIVTGDATTVPTAVVRIDDPRVMVSAVKLADDGSGDLIVRMWEATGDRVRTVLASSAPIERAQICDLLEVPTQRGEPAISDGQVLLELLPFQLLTIRMRLGRS